MKFVVAAIVAAICEYFFMVWLGNVPLFWPMILWHLVIFFGVFAGVCAIRESSERVSSYPGAIFGGVIVGIALLIMFYFAAFGQNMSHAADLRDLGNVKIATKTLEVVDTQHIRLIPIESASWIGNQVLGKDNLGALYHLEKDHYEIQRVRNTLYWVAPLEFNGFMAWGRAERFSPGYVMVNAEDPNADPKLVTGYKMRYTLGAFWSHNLIRHIFYAYPTATIMEPTFEVDEAGHPWYVISLTRPTVGFIGHKLTAVVIMDPETGEFKEYPIGKTPAWADRVFPEQLAEDYANWWGEYVHGWWNATVGMPKDAQKLTEVSTGKKDETKQDVFLVYNSLTSHPIWVGGMTSMSSKDQALTGYITVDSITGEMIFYKEGGYGNENKALESAEAHPAVAIQKNYHAAQAVFYNLYGTKAWVVSILSPSHIVEKVAIVYAQNTQRVAVGSTKAEALDAYKDLLSEVKYTGIVPTHLREAKILTGKVTRLTQVIVDGKTKICLMLDSHPTKVLIVPPDLVRGEVLMTKPGDLVSITCYDTTEPEISVKAFDNKAISLQQSEPQKEFEARKQEEATVNRQGLAQKMKELERQQRELKQQMQNQ